MVFRVHPASYKGLDGYAVIAHSGKKKVASIFTTSRVDAAEVIRSLKFGTRYQPMILEGVTVDPRRPRR